MAVQLDACIHCNLCVRACREVQVNDVIGMALRGSLEKIVFDFDDPMGGSTCVACGECVQACPTGALMEKSHVDATTGAFANAPDRTVDSICPYCGVGCQLTYEVKDDKIIAVQGRDGPLEPEPALREGPLRLRLHPPCRPPYRAADPAGRRLEARHRHRSHEPCSRISARRRGTRRWSGRPAGSPASATARGGGALAGFGSAKGSNEEAYLFQKLVRTGFGTNNVDHCTRLCHASSVAGLLEGVGSGAVSAPFMAAKDAEVIVVIGANPTENHPVAATFFKNAVERGAKLVVMDPRGPGPEAFRDATCCNSSRDATSRC